MADLLPSKTITLRMAYDRFSLWESEAPVRFLHALDLSNAPHPSVADRVRVEVARLSDTMLAEFRGAFARGELEAGVREPGSLVECAIPAEAWNEAFFPERIFLADEAPAGLGGYFDNLARRTPFIRRSEFEPWLADKVAERAGLNCRRSPTVSRLLDLVVGLAQDGMASSRTIEAWLEKWGLPPLAREPPPGKFDPALMSDWSLAMTVLWIVRRDLGSVRRAGDDYRAESLEWHCFHSRAPAPEGREFYEVRGEELKPPSPVRLLTLRMLEAIDDSFPGNASSTVYDARLELWNACGEGRLHASAVGADGGVVVIPEHEWSRLELAGSRRGDDYLVWSHDSLKPAYRELKFPRLELLKLWPPAHLDNDTIENVADALSPIAAGPKLRATCEAIHALYPDGVPSGLVQKQLLKVVNEHLVARGSSQVEMTTLRRALDALRSQ